MIHTIYIILFFVLLAWIAWSAVRDLLPIVALKDSKAYIIPTLTSALLPLAGLVACGGLLFVGDNTQGYIWSVAFGFLAATFVLEFAVAFMKGERKQVHGRTGLKMPYRAPISLALLVAVFLFIPGPVYWLLVVGLIVAGLPGIWGKNKLRSAVYWTTSELKDIERKKAKK